jgi:Fe-S cluster assembly protein SufD
MTHAKPRSAAGETGVFWEKFERLAKDSSQPPWLLPLRRAGMSRFVELGFPTLQDEDWRFTNVAPIAKLPFKPVLDLARDGVTEEALGRLTFATLKGLRMVFVNGRFAPELSSVPTQPHGIRISSLASALKTDAALIENHLARHARVDDNAFAALNAAFFLDGASIYVPAGQAVEAPIRLLYLTTAQEVGASAHPRNLIIAERGSQVTVIEHYASAIEVPHFTNVVTELVAGESAVVEHCKFIDESTAAFHMATIQLHCSRASNVVSHSLVTGAKLSRNNIRTVLAGEGVECILNGLYLTKGDQLADHHMIVEHAAPHCASHEYFNGILQDRSRGVFHGRILVRPGAQKTDAKQTNKHLLLSDEATADTKPQLEIYADDVKCTHGATVGQLNQESIFYLRSRGIGLETARRMLIHAFAGEITERVRCAPVREELDKLVWDRLEQNEQVAVKQ